MRTADAAKSCTFLELSGMGRGGVKKARGKSKKLNFLTILSCPGKTETRGRPAIVALKPTFFMALFLMPGKLRTFSPFLLGFILVK